MISEELKKMFEGRIAMDMHYVGKSLLWETGENLRGKIELWDRAYGQWVYQAYRLSAQSGPMGWWIR